MTQKKTDKKQVVKKTIKPATKQPKKAVAIKANRKMTEARTVAKPTTKRPTASQEFTAKAVDTSHVAETSVQDQPKVETVEVKAKPGIPPKGFENEIPVADDSLKGALGDLFNEYAEVAGQVAKDLGEQAIGAAKDLGGKAIDAAKQTAKDIVKENPEIALKVTEVAVKVALNPQVATAITFGKGLWKKFGPK